MKILTNKILYGSLADKDLGEKEDDIYDIEVIKKEFCCKRMKDAWEDNFIGFGDYEPPRKKSMVCIYSPFHDNMQIKFCPFCGEKIKIRNIRG